MPFTTKSFYGGRARTTPTIPPAGNVSEDDGSGSEDEEVIPNLDDPDYEDTADEEEEDEGEDDEEDSDDGTSDVVDPQPGTSNQGNVAKKKPKIARKQYK